MFSNLLFLILVLMMASVAPDIKEGVWQPSIFLAFSQAIGIYLFVALFLAWMGTLLRSSNHLLKRWPHNILNFLLVIFLLIYHFVFVAHRAYAYLPILGDFHFIYGVITLSFYLGGLAIFYYFALGFRAMYIKIRFLLPFVLPFLSFVLIVDLMKLLPFAFFQEMAVGGEDSSGTVLAMLLGTFIFLLLLIIFFPFVLQWSWGCEPLEDEELVASLEPICERAGFRHAGFRSWAVMRSNLTAAILGVVPRFRYILFSNRLLADLSLDQIKAVLAHEIGHSHYKHLLFYPLMVLGMLVFSALCSLFFEEAFAHHLALRVMFEGYGVLLALAPFLIFAFYALIILFYFRFLVGFFSRLFERQADLHVFSLGIPSDYMVSALDRVGVLSGNIHKEPNWHHYSIQERMDFLRGAEENPFLIKKHHRRVMGYSAFYLLLLLIGSFLLLSPLFEDFLGVEKVSHYVEEGRDGVDQLINHSLREEVAKKIISDYSLRGDQELIQMVLTDSLQRYAADSVPGVVEFYGAQILIEKGEVEAAVQLMIEAWKSFDFGGADPSVLNDFHQVTYLILEEVKIAGMENLEEVKELIKIFYASILPE